MPWVSSKASIESPEHREKKLFLMCFLADYSIASASKPVILVTLV